MSRYLALIVVLSLGALGDELRAQSPSQALEPQTGDQSFEYVFPPTGETMPVRVYVPTTWDGETSLPIVLFLHGAGSNERSYLEMNDGQMMRLAEEHGYIIASPLGYRPLGAYGSPLRLPAVFGESEAAAEQRDAVTLEKRRELALSELEVITVLEIVTEKYNADRTRTFLAGHSMGSGGSWHLVARYPERWAAVAPLSGPFLDREFYPFDSIRHVPIFVTEGTGAEPSLIGSRALRDFLEADGGFNYRYMEVDGNHGSMIPMVLPSIFEFFDSVPSRHPGDMW